MVASDSRPDKIAPYGLSGVVTGATGAAKGRLSPDELATAAPVQRDLSESVARGAVKGATLVEGLQKALNDSIAKLPIPKVMSYQLETGCDLPGWSSVSFVRPAHGLVALHGATVVPGIFAAVPYCVDLIGGPYLETVDTVCKAFRPKSAVRPVRVP